MAEETYTYMPADTPDGKNLMIFSTTGPKGLSDFKAPLDGYIQSSRNPQAPVYKHEGFVILDQGQRKEFIQSQVRQIFEDYVKPPLVSLGKAGDILGNALSSIAPGMQGVPLNRHALEQSAQTATPEGTAATGALIGATAATGSMSGLLPSLLRTAASASAYGTSMLATGSEKEQGRAAIGETIGIAAATLVGEGAGALANRVLFKSVNTQVNTRVAEKLMDMVKADYPELSALPQGVVIETLSSTPKGVQKLSQIGIEALRSDTGAFVESFVSSLPDKVLKGSEADIRTALSNYISVKNDYFNNLGRGTLTDTLREKNIEAAKALTTILSNAAVKMNIGDYAGVKFVSRLMEDVYEHESAFMQKAEIISLFRRAGQQSGFDRQSLAKEVVDVIKDRSGYISPLLSSTEEAILAGESRVIQKSIRIPGTGNIPMLKHLGISIPLGIKYATQAVTPLQQGVTVAIDQAAVRSFIESTRK